MKAAEIIYIVGANRSGSTILSAVLGSHDHLVAVGEMSALLQTEAELGVCGCGKPVAACGFWTSVRRQMESRLAPSGLEDLRRLQERFERFRSLPRLTFNSLRRGPDWDLYSSWNGWLLDTIAREANASHVVDESKTPARALALLCSGRTRVCLLHLVRDPRAVVWSKRKLLRWDSLPAWLRSPSGIALRVGLDWNLINLLSERVAKMYAGTPYVRLRYEDFSTDPSTELLRVGAAFDVDLDGPAELARRGAVFGFAHIASGNVVRQRSSRPITMDREWEAAAPRWLRRMVWMVCGPLARRYGYRP